MDKVKTVSTPPTSRTPPPRPTPLTLPHKQFVGDMKIRGSYTNHQNCSASKEANWSGSALLPLSMLICINKLDQVIWLAENWKWVWYLNLFSCTRVNKPISEMYLLFLAIDKPILLPKYIYIYFFFYFLRKTGFVGTHYSGHNIRFCGEKKK